MLLSAAAERPITVPNADDVRKILSGEKTQMRRILSPRPVYDSEFKGGWVWKTKWADTAIASINEGMYPEVCPHGQPGQHLWARESFVIGQRMKGWEVDRDADGDEKLPAVWHQADNEDLLWIDENGVTSFEVPWEPPIQMQRWASRIVLEIVSVRVERLQDISEEDAKAEGAVIAPIGCPDAGQTSYRGAFAFMWNQNHSASGSWRANPFVWSLSFRRLD
jgi:hypothetical protein